VVDDEEPILRLAKRTLESFGYRAVTAKDGVEALVTFAQEEDEIDAVLTDIMMPAMDGLALISALKSNHPDLRIIAASGVNTEAQLEKVVAAGANHFIPKPYTASALLGVLDVLLHQAPHPVGGA
jgi:CheY-like chemotaxis protein